MDTCPVSGIKAVGRRSFASILFRLPIIATVIIAAWPYLTTEAQAAFQPWEAQRDRAAQNEDARAEEELQTGIALTRRGRFDEAIPHFLTARGRVSNEFVLDFDLALCYVATSQFKQAIPILNSLRSRGRAAGEVYNLLAQAYIGNAQPDQAFEAFERAAALNPKNEKLYLYVADASMDHQYYTLGIDVVNLGLEHLPRSSRLYYQRGVLHSFLNQPDLARNDLELASKLEPGHDISYLAASQKGLLDGNIPATIQAARQGVQKDPKDYVLLTILGQALIRSGVAPGQPEFAEAQTALERAVTERPNFAASRVALGRLYRMANRLDDAITHLEIARQLAPENASVYSSLAMAYRGRGKLKEAREMLAILDRLNREQAAKYKAAPPDRKPSYTGAPVK